MLWLDYPTVLVGININDTNEVADLPLLRVQGMTTCRDKNGEDVSAVKEELMQLLESLPEEELTPVRDFVQVLLEEPENISEESLIMHSLR